MTTTFPAPAGTDGVAGRTAWTDEQLDAVFAPVIARIAEGAVAREQGRTLAHDEVAALRAERFGALRLPVELGGYGATVRQQFRLLVDLAAAESNLPQALRVIIPPLISQYLNLTKNSSLAIAVGYMDITGTLMAITLNQTGRELETVLLGMLIYLTLSLLISLAMNWYNNRVKLVER